MANIDYTRKAFSLIAIVFLLVLTFLIIKPIMVSIIVALVLAFVFAPVYDWLYKHTKSRNISAFAIILFLLAIIIIPIWFFTPILVNQAYEIYQLTLKIDFTSILKSIFPSLFASEQFATDVGGITSSFTSKIANNIVAYLAQIILNFPVIMIHLLVVFFTLFFVLRDRQKVIDYVKSVLPFPKEVEKRIFEYSSGITASLIYGQIIIGLIQGITLGIGLFIFRIPNALFLSLLAIFAGILPIIGTFIVWAPLLISLFITGAPTITILGVLFFGIISSSVDNIIRPIITSKRTKINSAILFVSMIGGLFFFGILGLILGPLIISYLIIFLEIYRGNEKPSILMEENL